MLGSRTIIKDSRSTSKRKYRSTLIKVILISIFLLASAGKIYYDTNSIEIKHYQIKNSSLGEVLAGLKVAFLSDLHMKSMGARENKILEIVNKEKPDLILVTGDMISFKGPFEPVMSFFHQFRPLLGAYGVLGNTEYSNENGSCILCHKEKSKSLKEKGDPFFLRNSSVPLKINGRILNIVGVDDPIEKKSDLRKALKETNPEGPSILLAHAPEIFDEASGSGIDLLLCGHTHGGQIFLTKYLRKVFPLERSLEFLDGFFQKGKTLMYVSRGIGTSFLPFRFGVKPEITFFAFDKNPGYDPSKHFAISNTPPTTVFAGLRLSNIFETFNLLPLFNISSHSNNSNILFDFESESDLKRLNWECHKWFELSEKHATSGKYSLKVILPPGQYPGIDFEEIRKDWSGFGRLRMDVFNPANEKFNFHIRIDDNKSGWEYADRFDVDFEIKPGRNYISIPTGSIRTKIHSRPLNLKEIRRMMVFIPNNLKQRELYVDDIRLE
jgi:predicted MPP superfamily phosphohydrolase